MIIDFHTHIFPPDVIKNRDNYLNDSQFASIYSDKKAKLIGYEELLRSMDKSDIDYAVCMGFTWESADFCGKQNEYFLEVAESSDRRIIPFASIPADEKIHIGKWIDDIKASGLAGIGEVAFYADRLIKNRERYIRALLDHAGKSSLPVCIHVNEPVGHSYPGKYDPELGMLYSVLKDCAGHDIILSHWGGGMIFYELMPEVKKNLKNIFYDTAASPFIYSDDIYQIALKMTGSEKILFGSDFPLVAYKRYLEPIKSGSLTDEERYNILEGNAKRILAGRIR